MKRHDHVLAFFFSLLSLPSTAIGNNITGDYCSLFLAPSSIPGAGLGVFVGNITHELGAIVSSDDIVIPLIDFKDHNNEKKTSFLWNEYMWASDQFSGMELEAKQVQAVSTGIGSTSNYNTERGANAFDEPSPIGISNAGVTSDSPGVGAFSPYFDRTFHSMAHIDPGSEVFVDYGRNYIRARGERFATQKALQSVHDLEWLDQHGQCMDHIRSGISTLPHAGRGAFAKRFIQQDQVVAPAPLIHLPNRDVLEMCKEERGNEQGCHFQLLLNYCFGHPQSTLLLCPYGATTAFINHSKENANAKIQWSESNSWMLPHGHWRNQSIQEWGHIQKHGLSFEYVALRDVQEGEEILIDYGDEWEDAWNRHVDSFTPRRPQYLPAFELNHRMADLRPYDFENNDVLLSCRPKYLVLAGIHLTRLEKRKRTPRCRILRIQRHNNSTRYVAEVYTVKESSRKKTSSVKVHGLLWDAPRDAFYFEDIPYMRDHHQPWSFRHEMMIPDSIFPEAWKNKKRLSSWIIPYFDHAWIIPYIDLSWIYAKIGIYS